MDSIPVERMSNETILKFFFLSKIGFFIRRIMSPKRMQQIHAHLLSTWNLLCARSNYQCQIIT